MSKSNILVLCTGNSCRSQMAEGYLRYFLGTKAKVYSAGIEAHGLNPKAVHFMLEDGIDISEHTSNEITDYQHIDFDVMITVCDHAKEHCPWIPSNAEKIHHSFTDPSKVQGSEESIAEAFRSVRAEIKAFSKVFSERY
jgi:arsenate reductase (thioredoxin)